MIGLDDISLVLAAIPLAIFAAGVVREFLDPVPSDPLEREQYRYATGEIDLAELELRIAVHLDPEAERIRSWAERRSGIGEATSFGIAARFETLENARSASREELESVPNVGEKRASALLEE